MGALLLPFWLFEVSVRVEYSATVGTARDKCASAASSSLPPSSRAPECSGEKRLWQAIYQHAAQPCVNQIDTILAKDAVRQGRQPCRLGGW